MIPIDKNELLKVLRQRYDKLKQWYEKANEDVKINASAAIAECFEIGHIVDDAPAVDAVPVVRCKDCKYFLSDDKACNIFYSVTTEDDYCVDMFGWKKGEQRWVK